VRFSNSDPITGQAAWYDVRVRISKAAAGEEGTVPPREAVMRPYPGMAAAPVDVAYEAGKKRR